MALTRGKLTRKQVAEFRCGIHLEPVLVPAHGFEVPEIPPDVVVYRIHDLLTFETARGESLPVAWKARYQDFQALDGHRTYPHYCGKIYPRDALLESGSLDDVELGKVRRSPEVENWIVSVVGTVFAYCEGMIVVDPLVPCEITTLRTGDADIISIVSQCCPGMPEGEVNDLAVSLGSLKGWSNEMVERVLLDIITPPEV